MRVSGRETKSDRQIVRERKREGESKRERQRVID